MSVATRSLRRSAVAAALVVAALLSVAVLGCHNVFDNPVDPEAADYVGYPVVGSVDEVAPASPADGATVPAATDLILTFSSMIGATAYEVQVSLSGDAFDTAVVLEKTGTTNEITIPAASVWSGMFYWRGRAAAQAGQWGAWSPVRSYSAAALLPTVSNWQVSSSFATGRFEHAGLAYNGYLYVIGGTSTPTTFLSDVQYARISADGTIGAWTTTTSITTARSGHAAVAYNGYLYVIGGDSGTARLSDVQYAPINADGSIGSWRSGTSLATGRNGPAAVASGGYLYVTGGNSSASSYLSDALHAPISADGSIGTWTTTTSLATARTNHAAVVSGGYLYVIGGYSGTFLNDVQYAVIGADGSIGTWSSATGFATARYNHAALVYGGNLYIIGGYSGSYLSDVQYAPRSPDGSIGTWRNTTAMSSGREAPTAFACNAYLYVVGGYTGTNRLSRIEYAAFDRGTPAATSTLPATTISPAGGAFTDATVTVTISNPAPSASIRYTIDGSTPTPTTGTQLQNGGTFQATPPVTVKAIAYITGIASSPVVTSQFAAKVATPVFSPTSGVFTSSVDVSISTTTSGATIRYTTSGAAPTSTSGTIYSGAVSLTTATTVKAIAYKSGCTDSDVATKSYGPAGSIGAWSAGSPFTTARYSHASVVSGGYLYVIGGYSSPRLTDVQFAPLNADGTVGSWAATRSLPTGRSGHAAVVSGGYLYVLGGQSDTSPYFFSDVQYAPINADGTLGSWSTTTALATGRYGHAAVVYSGYLYVVGGTSSSTIYLPQVSYAPINANGTLGSWSTTTALATGRYDHTAVASGGYLYVMGGYAELSPYYFSDVLYAPIDSNGTIGSWTATTSFTTGRYGHAAVVWNGYLYLIGGYTESSPYALSDVRYAPLNANGTLGSWSTTTSLVTGRYHHAAVLSGGYLYVIAGYSWSTGDALSDVQIAPFLQ